MKIFGFATYQTHDQPCHVISLWDVMNLKISTYICLPFLIPMWLLIISCNKLWPLDNEEEIFIKIK